jgi:hypothetical protein
MDGAAARVDHRDVVRRASLLVLLVVTALAGQAASAVAATGFGDPFDSLDGGRWSAGDHQLGRSLLDPANVAVTDGALELRHPAGTLDGAELHTRELLRTGTHRARIRAAAAASRPHRWR